MIRDIKNHKTAYTILALLGLFYLGLVYYLKHTPIFILFLTIGFASSYLIWGIIHHLIEKSLTLKIMLEYVLVAALGIAIITTLVL